MNRDPNPYHHQKPLSFPVAEREASAIQMQMTAMSPGKTSSEPPVASRDQTDSATIHHIPTSHLVPIASPEYDDREKPSNRIVVSQKSDVPQQVHYRYFFSLKTLIELISVLAAMIPMVIAPHLGAYQRGFQCFDVDIMYPFREGTVKPWVLYLVCLAVPGVAVLVGEYCRFFVSKNDYKALEVKYRLWRNGPPVPPFVVSVARIFLLFAYGFLIVKSVTDISKYAVGRLRPHFWDVCQPDMQQIAKTGGCGTNNYIMQFQCKMANSTDPKAQYRLRDARLSFLSGHSSMAFYSMFFVIFYLESRLRWMQLRYCKAILQFGLFLFAALTGMSRISDHKHHWTDVFAGAVLGLVVVVVTVFFIGDFFNDSRFLRAKIVGMLQKLDWANDEGRQFAQLLAQDNGRDPHVLRKIKHITRYPNAKVS